MKIEEMNKSVLHEIVGQGPDLALSTRERYLRDLDRWVDFAGLDMTDWTRKKVKAFYKEMIGRGVTIPSANRALASLRYATKWWALRENAPELDFAADHNAPLERQALTADEVTKLIAPLQAQPTPPNMRDLALIVLGLETGIRKTSYRLTIEGLTLDARGTDYPIALAPSRGDQMDVLPLSDALVAAIRPWLAWLGTQGVSRGPLFRGLQRRGGLGLGFTYTLQRGGLSDSSVQKILVARGDEADVGRIHPQTLRQTFSTWRAAAGMQPHEIAAVIGMHQLGKLSGSIDIAELGVRSRAATPAWLKRLLGVP